MFKFNFPSDPALDQVFVSAAGQLWKWDGIKWKTIDLIVGLIVPYAGEVAPDGYLICNGGVVSREQYAALFGVIGTFFGEGNGTTTFNLPDPRFRILVGTGELDSGGYNLPTPGGKWGVTHLALSEAQMPSHAHMMPSHAHTFDINHWHYNRTGGHGHGDPSHAHPDPSHAHTQQAGYWTYRYGGDYAYANWPGAGWYGNTSHNASGLWGAGVGLHNAGDLGGHAWWVSDTIGGWNSRATDWQAGATDWRGGNEAHTNIGPILSVQYIIKY